MMKIVVFEGIDKSGKYTQSNLLYEKLIKRGLNVVRSEFHRYDTSTGELIRKWLFGEYNVDQYTIELIMAADKQAQQGWFKELEDSGVDVLVLDRYIASQLCYGKAAGVGEAFLLALQTYMRKPDFEILLDIFSETSLLRKGKYGENDRYENDAKFLELVRRNYIDYFSKIDNGVIIDCETKTVDEIHEFVFGVVSRKLGI